MQNQCMELKSKHKRDSIKIVDINTIGLQTIKGLQCSNCKQRSQCVPKAGDNNNVFCLVCGNIMPVRSIRHARGLAIPAVQERPAIVQSQQARTTTRQPKTIVEKRRSELADSLTEQGYTVIDSQTVEYT